MIEATKKNIKKAKEFESALETAREDVKVLQDQNLILKAKLERFEAEEQFSIASTEQRYQKNENEITWLRNLLEKILVDADTIRALGRNEILRNESNERIFSKRQERQRAINKIIATNPSANNMPGSMISNR